MVAHPHEHPVEEIHEHEHKLVASTVGARTSGDTPAVHRHRHRHAAPMPDDPFPAYGRTTAFGVGMIHGIGAATSTQLLIFLTAAGAGGNGAGVLVFLCFLVGMITSNTLIALAATFGFSGASRNFGLYATVSILTATFSIGMGGLFVSSRSTLLPAISGG